MQYTNYAMKNNVFGTLSAPISSLATTIQLNTGQGQRFTADMLATLESMEGNKVTKREIVKITNVTGDTLTVIRKFAPCPSNDDANTQGQVSYSFSADDTISVYITKEHFDKIDGSINDLYDNGTNKLRCEVVSGLQVKVNPGPVLVGSAYYDFAGDTITLTNNATNYVEIDEDGDLVANTSAWGTKNTKIAKVTTSGGAVTSIEDRRLGTVGGEIGGVNIHDLTEKTSLSANDEFIISDSDNVYNNKKVKYSNAIKINGLTEKNNIADNDLFLLGDSTDSFNGKKLNFITVKNEIIYGYEMFSRTPMPRPVVSNDNSSNLTNYIGLAPYYFYWQSGGANMYKHSYLGSSNAREIITPSTITGISGYGYCDGICVYKGEIFACVYGYVSDVYKRSFYKISMTGAWTDAAARTNILTIDFIATGTPKLIGYDGQYFYICNGVTLYRIDLNGNVDSKSIISSYQYYMNEKGNIVLGITKNGNNYVQIYDNYDNMTLLNEYRISNSSTNWSSIWIGVSGDIVYMGYTISSSLQLFLPEFIINDL